MTPIGGVPSGGIHSNVEGAFLLRRLCRIGRSYHGLRAPSITDCSAQGAISTRRRFPNVAMKRRVWDGKTPRVPGMHADLGEPIVDVRGMAYRPALARGQGVGCDALS
jgi:hypothetical protein